MKIFILNLIPISLVFLFCTCKKTKIKPPAANLPNATQEGKNTMGFTIDDNVWVPYDKCPFQGACSEYNASYGPPGSFFNGLIFSFSRSIKGKSSSLEISSFNIGTITSTGDKTDSIYVNFKSEDANALDGRYAGPYPGSKFIITKLDKVNGIISGEFEFVLHEENFSGKKIILHEGRFDFIFNACWCSP